MSQEPTARRFTLYGSHASANGPEKALLIATIM
jgi:hypothetical protein